MGNTPLNEIEQLPLTRPSLPEAAEFLEMIRDSFQSGVVTNGSVVQRFEAEACRFTGAKYAVALSSCTSGLILSLGALDLPAAGEVVVPSFTFAATIEAILWNNLTPVYVDCLPGTLTIDPDEVVRAITPATAAICPVNVYGLPPDNDRLAEISDRYGIPLIFDSAQGLGATYKGRPSGGFGLCEVFSLSPSKVITAVEGGLVTTNDGTIAERVRSMRDYGKGPDGEDMIHKGLSARMSEFHAAVGLLNLRKAASLISARLELIRRYRERLSILPGCRTQEFPQDRTTSGNYFVLFIGKGAAQGRNRAQEELKSANIMTKKYYAVPAHFLTAFRSKPRRVVGDLRVTWAATRESLALPLYAHMTVRQQDRVCQALESLSTGK